MTLALIPIILRFWLRWRQRHPQPFMRNLSDALILLSWLSGIVLISINTWKNTLRQRYIHWPPEQLYYGVPRSQSAHLLYVSWLSLFFIYISLWAAKFALLAFYASLLRLQGRWARATLISAALFASGTFALHMALLTRWCSPTAANWDARPGRLCSAVHDMTAVTISTAANVATDVAILALPLFALASLRREHRVALGRDNAVGDVVVMGKAELSGLVVVLCMAALSITAALARFVTLELVQRVPKANITHTIDVWALVEIVASLLAVCLPSLRAFVRRTREEAAKRGSTDVAAAKGVGVGVGFSERSGSVDEMMARMGGFGEGVVVDLSLLEEGEGGSRGAEVAGQRVGAGGLSEGARASAHGSAEVLLSGKR